LNQIDQAARRIIAIMRERYAVSRTVVSVRETDFAHLDLAAYRSFRTQAAASGFRYLGDQEWLELSRSPTSLMARTMSRSMVSADGRVAAGYYQVKPRLGRLIRALVKGWLNLRFIDATRNILGNLPTRHYIDLLTEFDDGRSLVCSNAVEAAKISVPPTVERHILAGASWSALLDLHRRRLDEILRGNAAARPVVIASLDDLRRMHDRQHAQRAAHREGARLVSQEEMRGMCAAHPELADQVFAAVQKLLDAERPAG
jgi:hypothetical protein